MVEVVFLTRNLPPVVDGIGDYTLHLAREMEKSGRSVEIWTSGESVDSSNRLSEKNGVEISSTISKWNLGGTFHFIKRAKKNKAKNLIFQYNPFLYGRGGICLYMVFWIFLLKIVTPTNISVTFHELYNYWEGSPRYRILSMIHRAQFFLLGFLTSDLIFP